MGRPVEARPLPLASVMPPRRRKRLDPALFQLPVEPIRQGVYSDRSLVRACEILRGSGSAQRVTMQISCEASGYLGGIDEAVALVKLCSTDWSALVVHALYEGDRLDAWDTVMTIEGPYDAFGYLETLLLGCLARRTRLMTGLRAAVDAARPKTVLWMPPRQDHWLSQTGDGFAAQIAGAAGVSTVAEGQLGGAAGIMALPYALIAASGGDTVQAARAFADLPAGDEARVIAPADFENDCVGTSLALARALEARLWGVQLATPETLVDQSIIPNMGSFPPAGVNAQLVWNVRNALDGEGFGDVKIIVTGGLTIARIRAFEEEGVPVDAYGVGGAFPEPHIDFAADLVQVDGTPRTRAGREARANAKLEKVK